MAENTIPFDIALNSVRPFASQSEAEVGVNTTKAMNPLRVKQAIEKYLESYSSGWVFRGAWDYLVLDYKEGDMIRWLEILFLAKTDVPKNTPPMFPIDENDPYWEYLIGANIKGSVKAGILDIDGVAPIKYVEDEVFLFCRLLQDSELTLDLSELPINGVSKYLIIDGSGYDLTFGASYTVIKGNWDNRSGYYNIVELWYEEIKGVLVIIHNDLFSIGISEEEPSNNPTLWIDTDEEEPEAPAGMSAYEVWLSEGNSGTEQDFFTSLKGEQGLQGISAYQVWLGEGYVGTEEDFLNWLKNVVVDTSQPSNNETIWVDTDEEEPEYPAGMSAYETWLGLGNVGTEQDFIDSLKGEQGLQGIQGEHGIDGFPENSSGDIDIIPSGGNVNIDAVIRLGDGGVTNYANFDATGHLTFEGTARPWRDELYDAVSLQQSGTGVSRNLTEGTVEFIATAVYHATFSSADAMICNIQLNHDKDITSSIYPHIHWFQEKNYAPNFLLAYRWQINGGIKTTAWTLLKCNTLAFTYVSGSLNQISYSAPISAPSNAGISDILQFRIFRDTTNASTLFTGTCPYNTGGNATVGVTAFDIHFMIDSLGSTDEYVK